MLPVCWLHAQTDISFQHISTLNGLTDNDVTNAVLDKNGFLWISTSEGLNKFDGRLMKTFLKEDYPELRNNNIREVVCDDRNSDLRPLAGCVRTSRWRTGFMRASSSGVYFSKPSWPRE